MVETVFIVGMVYIFIANLMLDHNLFFFDLENMRDEERRKRLIVSLAWPIFVGLVAFYWIRKVIRG